MRIDAASVRIALAKALKPLGPLPGSLRVQRLLAPHRVNAGRATELIPYPFGPIHEANPGWLGSSATFVGWNAYFRGAYEFETLGILAHFVAPGATVVEVGANEGFHTVFAAWCAGRDGRVVAFEPNPTPRLTLRTNILRLQWMDRVRLIESAVADVPGERDFFLPDGGSENQGVGGLENNSRVPTRRVRVSITTLDSVEGITRCDLLKLDVQGAEALVLSGAAALVREHRPFIYFEVDDGGATDAIRLLREWNYRVERVIPLMRKPYFEFAPLREAWTGNCFARPV